MEEKGIRVCPCCNKEVERQNMDFTRDSHETMVLSRKRKDGFDYED